MCCGVAERYILQQVSEEVNRKCRPRNAMAQLSTPTPTLQTERQTDRRTEDSMMLISDHIVCKTTIR